MNVYRVNYIADGRSYSMIILGEDHDEVRTRIKYFFAEAGFVDAEVTLIIKIEE